jgi:hypothetical protein
MAYAQGGLIEATDYNNLINGTNQLNTVWSVGNGDAGYGQTAIGTVTAGTVVTATQWATLINRLNSVRNHQSGVGSGITAVTAGQTINHLSTLQTQVNTAFTNRGLFAAQGSTTTGTTDSTNPTAGATSSFSYFRDTNVNFSSGNAARYFFNAGGQINFVCSATNNGVNNTRNNTMRDMINQVGGLSAFRNTTNGGRSGTGGSIVTNNTAFGYRNMVFNSGTTIVDNDVSGTYSAHDVKIIIFTNNNDTANGANGNQIVFRLQMGAAADDSFGGAINLALSVRADIVFPSTTHLTNVWGTPSITFDSA